MKTLSDFFKAANKILKKKGMTDEQVKDFWEEADTDEPFSGVPYAVFIYNCNDQHVCEACRSIEGKHRYKSWGDADANAPIVPYEKCTSELGCRCWSTKTTDLVDLDED